MENINKVDSSAFIIFSEDRKKNELLGFFIFSLNNSIQLESLEFKEQNQLKFIAVDTNVVLFNVHSREFMTGRLGLMAKEESFKINSSIESIKNFISTFEIYRNRYLNDSILTEPKK